MSESDKFLGAEIDGRYRILEELGVGATGTVFRGVQIAVDREVAIKIMHEELQVESDFGQRFVLEAKAVASLDHPSILTLHDFGFWEAGNVHYMVTELVKGQPLEDMMRKSKGDIPVAEILLIAAQVADALAHAHDNNVIHRDMKPGNIMVFKTQFGGIRAKVLDFGLAQLKRDDVADSDLTQPGMIYGTPLYMSPEQVLGQRDLTPAVDVYAYGIMLYEMFEGRPPFYASSISDMLQQHLNQPPPPMVRARAPIEVEEMIERCLLKDPAERIQRADELLEVLYQFMQVSGHTETSMEIPRSLFEPTETEGLSEPSDDEIYELTELPSLFDLGDSALDAEKDQFHVGLWSSGRKKPQKNKAVLGAMRIETSKPAAAAFSDELPSGIIQKESTVKYIDMSFVGKSTSAKKRPKILEHVAASTSGGMNQVGPGMGIIRPAKHVDAFDPNWEVESIDISDEFLPEPSDLEEISMGMIETLQPVPIEDMPPQLRVQKSADSTDEIAAAPDTQSSQLLEAEVKSKNKTIVFMSLLIIVLVLALAVAIADPFGWLR